MGDSPLVRGVEVAVQYIRNKRRADPLRHCVNAVLIVITDGLDTCVGGSELRGTLELRGISQPVVFEVEPGGSCAHQARN